MSKSSRRVGAVTGAGILAIALAVSTAMASGNTVELQNSGVGVGSIEGFTVTDVDFTTTNMATCGFACQEEDQLITAITFDIVRDGANAATLVADANAEVWVQLRETPEYGAETAADPTDDQYGFYDKCTVTAGEATCTLDGLSEMPVKDSNELVVYAFDL